MSEKPFPHPDEAVKKFPILIRVIDLLEKIYERQRNLEREIERGKEGIEPNLASILHNTYYLGCDLTDLFNYLLKLRGEEAISREEFIKINEIFKVLRGAEFVSQVAEELEALMKQKSKEVVG